MTTRDDIMPESNVAGLGQLFAAPLNAVVEADFQAALKFLELIEKFGFEKAEAMRERATEDAPTPTPGDLGRLRMFSFHYWRRGADGEPEKVVIRVPALSLVPLPLLQIYRTELEFGVRILEIAQEPMAENEVLDLAQDLKTRASRKAWHAVFASHCRDREGSRLAPARAPNLNVKMQVRQADIPAGISSLLNIMSENVHEVQRKGNES